MTNIPKSYIGVDISKNYLDVCILPNQNEFRIKNNADGFKQLFIQLSSHDVEQVVCEATGGYENAMIKALKSANYSRIRKLVNTLFYRIQLIKVQVFF